MDYNLEERTAKFGEKVIKFCQTVKTDDITKPLISQIVKSATSIGANYMEANQGCSKKDFKNELPRRRASGVSGALATLI